MKVFRHSIFKSNNSCHFSHNNLLKGVPLDVIHLQLSHLIHFLTPVERLYLLTLGLHYSNPAGPLYMVG